MSAADVELLVDEHDVPQRVFIDCLEIPNVVGFECLNPPGPIFRVAIYIKCRSLKRTPLRRL